MRAERPETLECIRIRAQVVAERLDDRLGRAALIATVGNPFAFFRQFNEAEGRAGVRPFSEATLKLVAELEAGYFTPVIR